MHDCLVKSLGYIGLTTSKPQEWTTFAAEMLGMQIVHRSANSLALRMDEKVHRYLLDISDSSGLRFVGFDVGSPAELRALDTRLAASGVPLTVAKPEELTARQVDQMAWATDPDGTRIEFFCGLHTSDEPFSPAKPIGGFLTGELGIGHLVRYTPRYREMSDFYQRVLGFRLSDFHDEPFAIEFLRVNPRHHSIGLIEDSGPPRLHHAMVEYRYWDDVGRALDVALADPDSIAVTLGRHFNDHMTSFYAWTPDEFFMEIGWAGRTIDESTWKVEEVLAPSLWGHVRNWQSEAKRKETRKLVDAVVQKGIRAPVQVSGSGPFHIPTVELQQKEK